MKSHQKTAARFLITAFAVVVLLISASTSFGFFFTFFDALIPHALLGRIIAATISGVIGVLLFDAACSIWLYTFLHHAETAEQRAVSLIMTGITFLGAAAASVAHLALNAATVFVLDEATRESVGLISLICVIFGVVANFGASLAYQRYSRENKEKVRESDRLDDIQSAEDEEAKHLDQLVAKEVREQLRQQAPTLAREQARRIAARYHQHEETKYSEPPATGQTSFDGATNDKDPLHMNRVIALLDGSAGAKTQQWLREYGFDGMLERVKKEYGFNDHQLALEFVIEAGVRPTSREKLGHIPTSNGHNTPPFE